ncbi:NADP-reducing hydrogenase subunit HndD [bioreactor metagenome]|uniref:NADP-reducing hydrogenase subunit HndD n=1 Tax=bioreactor metagenome TaxID=1076179 RepID=A0A645A9H6_9ZZZZ
MEAALRTAYETITGEKLEHLEFEEMRGFQGIKTGSVKIGDLKVHVAVAHTLRNARQLMDEIQNGTADYHFIEVMACPGGCIGGGGQPYHHGEMDTLRKRASALYTADEAKVIRRSHENPDITKLYQDYLGEPNGHIAHELLHTHYTRRNKH